MFKFIRFNKSKTEKLNRQKRKAEHEGGLKKEIILPHSLKKIEQMVRDKLPHNPSLFIKHLELHHNKIMIMFIENLTNTHMVNEHIIKPLQKMKPTHLTVQKVKETIPIIGVKHTDELNQVLDSILRGWTYFQVEGLAQVFLFDTIGIPERALGRPEIETLTFGPQVGFTERLSTNTALIRSYITDPNLCNEDVEIGKISRTQLSIFYIKGIAEVENVNTLLQRITELDIDGVVGSEMLVQLIEDNSMSIFPNMLLTERPDRVISSLMEGKIAVLVDGGSFAIVCPSTFLEFFQSPEDYYLRWNMATFVRALRMFSVFLSIVFTPLYVAALTFHYEVIPSAILVPLAQSRARVPFPPLFEAVLLELIIELLREAGARLPTKVGQTIGIVGGIVIGQAAVQAGFTSNILIMIVALSALASFTTPSYLMGTTIRIIRFPMILLAGIWGGIGIMLGICFLIIHLLRQTSIGRPYFEPIYPLRMNDLKDSMVRMPFSVLAKRPYITRGKDKSRFNPSKATKKDIDE